MWIGYMYVIVGFMVDYKAAAMVPFFLLGWGCPGSIEVSWGVVAASAASIMGAIAVVCIDGNGGFTGM